MPDYDSTYYLDSNTFMIQRRVAFASQARKVTKTHWLLLYLALLSLAAIPFLARPVAADASTLTPGQPNQSCQSVFPTGPLSPAGFNTDGFAKAENVYAGSGQTLQTPANSAAVSQYDVACFQVAQH